MPNDSLHRAYPQSHRRTSLRDLWFFAVSTHEYCGVTGIASLQWDDDDKLVGVRREDLRLMVWLLAVREQEKEAIDREVSHYPPHPS